MRFATKDNMADIVSSVRGEYADAVAGARAPDGTTLKMDPKLRAVIDTALSATSTNMVQNCIVARPLLNAMGRVGILTDVIPDDWATLVASIANGDGEAVLPVGSQIRSPWTITNGATVYDAPWNVMHHTQVETEGGNTEHVAYLQMDRCLPFNTEFSTYQAFLYAIDGLPAGTYHVTMGYTVDGYFTNGDAYQFTLTQAVPAGGQLAGFRQAHGKTVSEWRVYSYANQTTSTALETVVVTAGSGGTNLGTFTTAGVAVPASGTPATTSSVTIDNVTYAYYGLNSSHRTFYGNNRWLHSAVRQYLNSSGNNWWSPQTVFDRPPSYTGHKGFLSGLDPDFLAVIRPVKVVTALNYVTDGGTSANPLYDTTYDRVFLPSTKEHYLALSTTYGGTQGLEGEFWDYWKRVAGTATPLSTGTYHPEYIQYDLASPTTPRACWERSAYRGLGYYVASVSAYGYCSNYTAYLGSRVAPACAIGESE